MQLNLPKKRTFTGPAALWKRLLAFVIDLFLVDLIILGPFRSLISTLVSTPESMTATFEYLQGAPGQANLLMGIFTLMGMFLIAYFVITQYLLGQTIGSLLLDLRIVTPAGKKEYGIPGFWQCFMRNIFLIPAFPFVLLWIIDPVYYFIARNHLRLSEWLSKTQVVQEYNM